MSASNYVSNKRKINEIQPHLIISWRVFCPTLMFTHILFAKKAKKPKINIMNLTFPSSILVGTAGVKIAKAWRTTLRASAA